MGLRENEEYKRHLLTAKKCEILEINENFLYCAIKLAF